MSYARICDNCSDVLTVNANGSDDDGLISSWLRVTNGDGSQYWDACTRACAVALIDGPIGAALDAQAEVIADIARTIREERARESDDEDDGDDE